MPNNTPTLEALEPRLMLSTINYNIDLDATNQPIWSGASEFQKTLTFWDVDDSDIGGPWTAGGYGVTDADTSLKADLWASTGTVDVNLDGKLNVSYPDYVVPGQQNVPVTIAFQPDYRGGEMSGYLGAGFDIIFDFGLDISLPGPDYSFDFSCNLEEAYNKLAPLLGLPKIVDSISLNTQKKIFTPSFGTQVSARGTDNIFDVKFDIVKLGKYTPASAIAAVVDPFLDLNLGFDLNLLRRDYFKPTSLEGNLYVGGSNYGSFTLNGTNSKTIYVDIPDSLSSTTLSFDIGNLELNNNFYTAFGLEVVPFFETVLKIPYVTSKSWKSELAEFSKDLLSLPSRELDFGITDPAAINIPVRKPEISVQGNGRTIYDGDTSPSTTDHTDFSSVNVSSGSVTRTFTVKNTGTGTLSLTGYPRVSISGSSNFTVTQQPSSSISSNGSSTFKVKFDPSSSGTKTATISIVNNDSNENPYNFAIKGTGIVEHQWIPYIPTDIQTDISIVSENNFWKGNVLLTFSNAGFRVTDWGTVVKNGSEFSVDVKVERWTGVSAQVITTVSHRYELGILDPGLHFFTLKFWGTTVETQPFTVDTSYPVVPQTVPHTQDFSSGKPGGSAGWEYYSSGDGRIEVVGGQLRMDSSTNLTDSLNEAILHLNLAGKSNVKLKLDHINSNDEDTSLFLPIFSGHREADGISFSVNGTTWYRLADLTSSFSNREFDLDAAVQVAGISYTSDFRIKFQQYDDYSWPVDGRAFDNIRVNHQAAPEIEVRGNNMAIFDGDTTPSASDHTNFGSVDVTSGSVTRTFTVRNAGTGTLNLTSYPRVSITGSSNFTMTQQPSSSVSANGGTTTFNVKFDPSSIGPKTATISIANNDSNENPYNFAIEGTGKVTVMTTADLQTTWKLVPTDTHNKLVPGDVYAAQVQVQNIGNTAAIGTMDLSTYFNDSASVPVGGAFYTLNDTPVYLVPGASAYYTMYFTVPTDPTKLPGDWYMVANVDDTSFVEDSTANNSAASTVQPLAWQFGAVDGRTSAVLTLVNPNTNVTTHFYLFGNGTGEVTGLDTVNGWTVNLTNTDATTFFYPVSIGGMTDLNNVTSDGPMNYFWAPTSDINGVVNIGTNDNLTYFYANSMQSGGQFNAGSVTYLQTVQGFNVDLNLAGSGDNAYTITYVFIGGDWAGTADLGTGGMQYLYVGGNSTANVTLADANGLAWWQRSVQSATFVGNQNGNWNVSGNFGAYLCYGDSTGNMTVSGLNDASYSFDSATIYGNLDGTWQIDKGGFGYLYVGGNSTANVTLADANGLAWWQRSVQSATFVGNQTGNWDINGTMNAYSVYGDSTGNMRVRGLNNTSNALNSATVYGNWGGTWQIDQGGFGYLYVGGNATADLTLLDATGGPAWWYSIDSVVIIGQWSGAWNINGSANYLYGASWINGLDYRSTDDLMIFYAGGMKDSTVYVGVNAGFFVAGNKTTSLDGIDVWHLPQASDLGGDNRTIGSFYILGTADPGNDVFINSSIAADNLNFGYIQRVATVNNQGFRQPFGVTSPNITTLYYFDGQFYGIPEESNDFTIRIV